MRIYIAFLLLHLLLLLSPTDGYLHHVHHSMHDNATDQLALLSFESCITRDPFGVLQTWNTNTSFCNWQGITCDSTTQRVIRLKLPNLNLEGTLSPHMTNLTFLRVLNLYNNSFHGPLPVDVGRLFRLHVLSITNNYFQGHLPSSLSLCSKLSFVSVSYNRFKGHIPSELGNLGELRGLDLQLNEFTGQIPPSLTNLSLLQFLYITSSGLGGPIPTEFGRLQNLLRVSIQETKIEGEIPHSLLNISSLITVQFTNNRLSGILPSEMFSTLPSLVEFYVCGNYLSGPIPSSLANASNLEYLVMGYNSFSGPLPLLNNLRKLRVVNLNVNQLGSDSHRDMDIITSLANANHLEKLSLSVNKLRGVLPSSVGNLSKVLSTLYLADNQLEGKLPTEISHLTGLTQLAAENNLLEGKLSQLYELALANNSLTGTIPSSLSSAQQLQFIDLSYNMLGGTIPREIFGLPNLVVRLDLSSNRLSGSVPIEVGKLTMLQSLDISNNQITGELPTTVGACISLSTLNLSRNSFQGPIPSSLANLKSIDYIDLSSNNLSGEIPSTLQSLKLIKLLNLSMNQLKGEVPEDGVFRNSTVVLLHGNPNLCGGASALAFPKCKIPNKHSVESKMKLVIVVVACAGFTFLSCLFIFVFWRRNKKGPQNNAEVVSFEGPHRLYTYHDLRIATNNFSAGNLIGEGSFTRVYKAILSDDTFAAIKVFNMNHDKLLKRFYHECEALRTVRHRNLVKIISVCSSIEFKALVLKFMPNGSLEQWLSRPVSEFTTTQKLKVAADVATAMEYLHHDCESPVVHCDLKPSNILLDEDMIAHVADFGIARILHENPNEVPLSSTLGLKGSVGYIAPEYGMCGEASRKGDVYSYGILLLEMFAGKKPTDELFTGDLDLQKWVAAALTNRLMDIVDPELVEEDEAGLLVSILKTGLACASMSPVDRPTMRDVSNMIRSAQK